MVKNQLSFISVSQKSFIMITVFQADFGIRSRKITNKIDKSKANNVYKLDCLKPND